MAKFAVGEIAIVACADFDPPCPQPAWTIGEHVEIIGVGPYPFLNEADYMVQFRDGTVFPWDENTLRKLPPDDHADDKDTIEDPGLTRLKKLLKHEIALHKKPITTPETET